MKAYLCSTDSASAVSVWEVQVVQRVYYESASL